ncbi:MAG: enoyl-ACP reductase [Candidatus Eisenbacteria bacterium]
MIPIDLSGKHALVLGVANHRSIAWAIAEKVHAAGAALCLTYANERMRPGVEELAATLPGVFTMECDVSMDSHIDAVMHTLAERWGSLECLVHGVAYANKDDLEGTFVATSREGFRLALEVSAYSLLNITNRALPLLEKHGASIISMSFLAAERAVPAYNVMGSAKAVLEQSTRQLAYELGPRNIRVNAVSAGPLNTLAARGISGLAGKLKQHSDRAALRRNITKEEVGNAGLFLLCDLSSGITGEVMYVDAGYRMMGG